MMNKQDVEHSAREAESGMVAEMDVHSFTLTENNSAVKEAILYGNRFAIIWLSVLDCGLLILGMIYMLSVFRSLDMLPGHSDSLLLADNLVLGGLFSFAFRYTDLSEGRYSLGKAALIALHLVILNTWMMFGLSEAISIPTVLMFLVGFGSMALISGWYHFEVSQPFSNSMPGSLYYLCEKKIKRVFDFSSAALGLLAISPLMGLCFVLLALESKGSPIFCQTRIGENATPFCMFKFRSMVRDAERQTAQSKQILHKCQNDPRVTPFGKIIRKLSIDELPQLWNVVLGEMSLVGPRPPLPSEYELMNAYHRRKFEATPGLTGLWQVIGRVENQRDFNSVALYDTHYIENWCLIEDIKILMKTIPVVLLQKGAS